MLFRLNQMRQSFFSGHATVAMYASIYLVIYIEKRFVCQTFFFLKLLVQNLLLCIGFWVGLTRVSDNMHHWSDVLVGDLVGACFGCLFARLTCNKLSMQPNLNRTSSGSTNHGSYAQLAKREKVMTKVIVASPSDHSRHSRDMPVSSV